MQLIIYEAKNGKFETVSGLAPGPRRTEAFGELSLSHVGKGAPLSMLFPGTQRVEKCSSTFTVLQDHRARTSSPLSVLMFPALSLSFGSCPKKGTLTHILSCHKDSGILYQSARARVKGQEGRMTLL